MSSDVEIEAKFWKELRASPFILLGLDGARDGHGQPMTAFFDDDHGPIWFFASRDSGLVQALPQSHRAAAHYAAKGHDLFATIHGELSVENNGAVIDRLWNRDVAAWYPGGRDDPKVTLLRLDTESAQIWLGASAVGAAVKRMLGGDPKRDQQGKVAQVTL